MVRGLVIVVLVVLVALLAIPLIVAWKRYCNDGRPVWVYLKDVILAGVKFLFVKE